MYSYSKILSLILVAALLLQSCAVYKHSSVSLEQAAASHRRVLMIRNDGDKIRLNQVEFEHGKYYGIKKVHGQKVRIPLDQSEIAKLRPINRPVTTLGNIGIALLGALGVVIAIFASDSWDDSRGNEPIF